MSANWSPLPVPSIKPPDVWGATVNAAIQQIRSQIDQLASDPCEAGRRRASFQFLKSYRNNASTGILFLGSSSHEGVGKQNTSQRVMNQALKNLRTALYEGAPKDYGRGYIPAYYATAWPMADGPIESGEVPHPTGIGGLGARSSTIRKQGTASSIEFPALDFNGEDLEVVWTRRTDTRNFEVYVDNVLAETIYTWGSPVTYGMRTFVPMGSGAKVIRLENNDTTYDARVEGIVHRTSSEGIVLYDHTRSGGNLPFYLDGNRAAYMWESVENITDPIGLVVIGLGTNDMAEGQPGLAAWETRLTNLLAEITTRLPDAGVVFFMQPERIQDAAAQNTVLEDYTRVLKKVLDGFDNATMLEESTYWRPRPGSTIQEQDPHGWLTDTVHHGPDAAALLGRALAEAVLS